MKRLRKQALYVPNRDIASLAGFHGGALRSRRHDGVTPSGDPRFHALLKQMGALHDKKQQDYGRATDPFANVRASDAFGIAPWVGCMIRANDKMRRIQQLAQTGTLKNESVEDSLMDLAVYSLIGLILYREGFGPSITDSTR